MGPKRIYLLDYYLNSNCSKAKNGVEILKKIKKRTNNVDVVFLSSLNKVDQSLKAIQYGACDFITKEKNSCSELLKVIYALENRFNLGKINSQKKWIFRGVNTILVLLLILFYFYSISH
ncbi:MAG: response regulator [Bacteroidota bacterium]|nr:response regulator [Bacteroidota bacterium]